MFKLDYEWEWLVLATLVFLTALLIVLGLRVFTTFSFCSENPYPNSCKRFTREVISNASDFSWLTGGRLKGISKNNRHSSKSDRF